jgi:hypothetical protein
MQMPTSSFKDSTMTHPFVSDPPQCGPPELWARTARDVKGHFARSAQPVQYFVEPALFAPTTDSVDVGEARLIFEMRYQEYVARRALEELFESGELELLAI